jgi:DNA polymerase III sliding clamp (beta) subunit (PCNA family)
MKPIVLPMQEVKPAIIGFGKIISRRSTLPVLNHIRIERTKDGWIALTVTDLDVFATLRLEQPAEGEPVTVLIGYEDLVKIAKSCTKIDMISLQCGENASELSVEYPVGTQRMQTKVSTLPVNEFPEIPRIKGDSIPLPETLRSALHEAFDCASVDETRLILNSAFIDVTDSKGHYVVGTNGGHLYASNSFSLPLKESVILPTHKFLGWKEFNADGEWQMKVGEKPGADEPAPVQITSRRWRFITKQHDGRYPNWKHVVPSNDQYRTGIRLATASLESLVKTIERLPDHDQKDHAIGIEVKGNTAHLLCKTDKEAPWTPVPLAGAEAEGADITFSVNRHYLIKALSFGLNRLEFIDTVGPMRFSNGGRQMIVMPVRGEAAPQPQAAPAVESTDETQPAAPTPAAAQPERKEIMAENTTAPVTLDAQLDQCLDDIETLKEVAQEQVTNLTSLRAKLKIIQREHKAGTKELQSVRQTLKSLQSMKL